MTTMHRIPFGLDRLPRSLAPDDPRLPSVTVGNQPLRLNTEPLPAEAMAQAGDDHAARVMAMREFLHALCGDYAPIRQRFVDVYLDGVAAHVDANRAELAAGLARYDGLYAPDDWLWSALRPLPRAWLRTASGMVPADIAFWDGARAIAVDLDGKLQAEDLAICRVTQAELAGEPLSLLRRLPPSFRCFWRGQALPVSPFRRPIPRGVLAEGG